MKYEDISKKGINKKLYNIDAINTSIENIITTPLGSIPGLPEFGTNIRSYIFEQMDAITVFNIQEEIYDALERWEDRISDISVHVNKNLQETGLIITIKYTYNYSIYSTDIIVK